MANQEAKYDVSRAKAILILIILTLLYTMAYMDRSVMTVVVAQLKADIGLTDGQIGFLQTTFMVGVGLMMIPCGVGVDRWNRHKTDFVFVFRCISQTGCRACHQGCI